MDALKARLEKVEKEKNEYRVAAEKFESRVRTSHAQQRWRFKIVLQNEQPVRDVAPSVVCVEISRLQVLGSDSAPCPVACHLPGKMHALWPPPQGCEVQW